MGIKPCYVYGPVPSRRLGKSLGIDIIPFKVCSYDCIYCQLGKTTSKTNKRQNFTPLDRVLSECEKVLKGSPKPDCLTISGSGEPTLHSGLEDLVKGLKNLSDIPLVLITNGSLLWDRDVQKACAHCDIVIPSLDAGDELLFRYINKPTPSLGFSRMIEGIVEFSRMFKGKIWLEVMLLEGINTLPADLENIKNLVNKINPDKIQLNTAVRPTGYDFVVPVNRINLKNCCSHFGSKAEIVPDYKAKIGPYNKSISRESIMSILKRRPCSLAQMASSLGVSAHMMVKDMDVLLKESVVRKVNRNGAIMYMLQKGVPYDQAGSSK